LRTRGRRKRLLIFIFSDRWFIIIIVVVITVIIIFIWNEFSYNRFWWILPFPENNLYNCNTECIVETKTVELLTYFLKSEEPDSYSTSSRLGLQPEEDNLGTAKSLHKLCSVVVVVKRK
jgi:hypothetical protein